MEHITLLIGIVIVTALVFDFTNGFHDTANAMATTISTGALKPKTAVAMSAVLNLVGAFLSVEVAKTISGGIIDESAGIRPEVIFAALVGAILWNLLTWLAGLPSSSSHALFGGLIGATVASAGIGVGQRRRRRHEGPHPGRRRPGRRRPRRAARDPADLPASAATPTRQATAKGYRAGQIASAGLVSLAHGTNDAQKTMGVITLALIAGGVVAPDSDPPLWVIVSAGLAIALGTYLGGWRIIRTMGKGLTDIQPPQGFAAQTSAATVILASSHLGFSLSTTQVCSGSVMGAGLGRKGGVVRWSHRGPHGRRLGPDPAGRRPGRRAAPRCLADQGDWGVTTVAVLALAACSRDLDRSPAASPSTTTNVNDAARRTPSRPGVVTTAIAAVAPPPAGHGDRGPAGHDHRPRPTTAPDPRPGRPRPDPRTRPKEAHA